MTFDDWLTTDGDYLNDSDDAAMAAKLMARRAWDAAVAAERERCARIADEHAGLGPLPKTEYTLASGFAVSRMPGYSADQMRAYAAAAVAAERELAAKARKLEAENKRLRKALIPMT
jgi:hypothetical protein